MGLRFFFLSCDSCLATQQDLRIAQLMQILIGFNRFIPFETYSSTIGNPFSQKKSHMMFEIVSMFSAGDFFNWLFMDGLLWYSVLTFPICDSRARPKNMWLVVTFLQIQSESCKKNWLCLWLSVEGILGVSWGDLMRIWSWNGGDHDAGNTMMKLFALPDTCGNFMCKNRLLGMCRWYIANSSSNFQLLKSSCVQSLKTYFVRVAFRNLQLTLW